MSETPNDRQRELIDHDGGIALVDAGAGTGKTFAITRRYARLLDRVDVEPDDLLLLTFTNNAAAEMKGRIVNHCEYGAAALYDAPIQTFHSLCHDILRDHGLDAPSHLGIDDRIGSSIRLLENETVEAARFREFYGRFVDEHPEHHDRCSVVADPGTLRRLIGQLAAKGVFPTCDGWYRNGERYLDGDFEAFRARFDELNAPRNDGRKQSRLRERLNRFGSDRSFLPDAPAKADLRGSGKSVPDDAARLLFDRDRTGLKRFVHDVYFEYLEFALSRNFLTFGMLQLFAFVLLCEAHDLRGSLAFEHVLIDEFQDTSEIQFKLALLLCGSDDLCLVGDWKQSIYAFQYASVENIVQFETRLNRFVSELNDDEERVVLTTDRITGIPLVENYRSTQAILDLSEAGLVVPATKREPIDADEVRDRIVSLTADTDHDHTRIEAISCDDEHEAVLATVQKIVGNEDYAVRDDGTLRPPSYGDIAVLTRTHDFGRELLPIAEEYRIPATYEGGVELFKSDQAKLALAWLRILEDGVEAGRGWVPVLEEAGYTMDEIRYVLRNRAYPADMLSFRDELRNIDHFGGVARAVLSRYGYDGAYAAVLMHAIQSIHDSTTMTRGDLIRFVHRGIENGARYEVHASEGVDAVTVQTIHAAKGLEHPIVILANVNRDKFPPSRRGGGEIIFRDPIGLRERKVSSDPHGQPHVYDDWRSDGLRCCLPRDYDEERRLLYVAMTRARDHLILTAGENPSPFVEELPVRIREVEPQVEPVTDRRTEQSTLTVSVPTPEGPVGYTPHDLMDDSVFEDVSDGEGTEFGNSVHEFAEAYARGEDPEPGDEADYRHVVDLVDSLDGELHIEDPAYLPLQVNGKQRMIVGVVDLVHVRPDRVEVIDFKTDRSRHAHEEYVKQLSVYYHVVGACYPKQEVTASVYYTERGDRVPVDAYPVSDLEALVGSIASDE